MAQTISKQAYQQLKNIANSWDVDNNPATNVYASSATSSNSTIAIPWVDNRHSYAQASFLANPSAPTAHFPETKKMYINQRKAMVGGDVRLQGRGTIHTEEGPELKIDYHGRLLKVVEGRELEISLPDGSRLLLDKHGNFVIRDEDAQVTYQANRNRAFNPFVNAGDRIADFIEYVGTIPGVRREDVSQLPLQLFVNWLIIEAAERDGDPVPDDVEEPKETRLLKGTVKPQCELPTCRRFIQKAAARSGFRYCNPGHAEQHHNLLKAA